MQKTFLILSKMLSFLLLNQITHTAQFDLQELGFESKAEQLSLIVQKNKETVFENIDLPWSHFFPTPLYASFWFSFYASPAAAVFTYIDRSNGFFKNWAMFSLGFSLVYPTLPFVFVDSLYHLYNFIKFKKNKTSVEHTENLRIREIDNNKVILSTRAYQNYFKTSWKLESLLWDPGITVARQGFMSSDYNWYEKNEINFSNPNNHDENTHDLGEDNFNIIQTDAKKDVEAILDNIIDTVISMPKEINGRELMFKFFLNETTRIVYSDSYKDNSRHDYFLYNVITKKLYPLLQNYDIVDVRITPDEHALIVITPTKTIKIDLTKDMDLTKEQLEKELRLKNRKEKVISLMSKSTWWLFFLCYSQWWFKYFFNINLYHHTKTFGSFLKKNIPSLLSLPLDGIKSIVAHVTLKNIGEFLFGRSEVN